MLDAWPRSVTGHKLRGLRKEGRTPAILFSLPQNSSQLLALDSQDVSSLVRAAGSPRQADWGLSVASAEAPVAACLARSLPLRRSRSLAARAWPAGASRYGFMGRTACSQTTPCWHAPAAPCSLLLHNQALP